MFLRDAVRLLEVLGQTGSISVAGRSMEQETRETLAQPIVDLEQALARTQPG